MPTSTSDRGRFSPGLFPGAVLPDFDGLGLANVAPTVARHFGLETALPGLADDVLPPRLLDGVDCVVTLLIDALGYDSLRREMERGGAPYLQRLARRESSTLAAITSTFPSGTPTALTTLNTGLAPIEHGLTSGKLYDADLGTTIDTLYFAPVLAGRPLAAAGVDPVAWLGQPSVYQRLAAIGVRSVVVDHAEYETGLLSTVGHPGARYIGFRAISDLAVSLRAAVESEPRPAYLHAYWGTLDAIAHRYGIDSAEYRAELRVIDHALGEILLGGLRSPRTLVMILADHGQIDADAERFVWLNDHPDLLELLTSPPAGGSRGPLLYVRSGREAEAKAYVAEHLADCAYPVDVEEALGIGLFGPGQPSSRVRQRLGQLLVLARENWTIRYEYPGKERRRWKTGMHGGMTREEMVAPLLAFRLDAT